jgi:hypothetical protein
MSNYAHETVQKLICDMNCKEIARTIAALACDRDCDTDELEQELTTFQKRIAAATSPNETAATNGYVLTCELACDEAGYEPNLFKIEVACRLYDNSEDTGIRSERPIPVPIETTPWPRITDAPCVLPVDGIAHFDYAQTLRMFTASLVCQMTDILEAHDLDVPANEARLDAMRFERLDLANPFRDIMRDSLWPYVAHLNEQARAAAAHVIEDTLDYDMDIVSTTTTCTFYKGDAIELEVSVNVERERDDLTYVTVDICRDQTPVDSYRDVVLGPARLLTTRNAPTYARHVFVLVETATGNLSVLLGSMFYRHPEHDPDMYRQLARILETRYENAVRHG